MFIVSSKSSLFHTFEKVKWNHIAMIAFAPLDAVGNCTSIQNVIK